jgi:hypothetical protein
MPSLTLKRIPPQFKEGDIVVERYKDQSTYYLVMEIYEDYAYVGNTIYKLKNLHTNIESNISFGTYDKISLAV